MLGIIRNSSIAKANGRSFAASVERVDGVALMRLKGRVSTDGGDLALRSLVFEALRSGERHILIDLKSVSLIDYSGVRELVSAYFAAIKWGATIRLCSLSEKVLTLFQMVELLRVFDVRTGEEEGLAAFVTKAAA
jgi:anti-sigma B factor antagonist